ncbi:LuxR C-terminal-related transcriptional regulator [Streptomyces sp. NPDC126514]|uniref:helix-turn-helix transcriptional regulator n=1 Tax=Streptomyces sp. NPDC126514 TaxID=3155210 RepID=UPI00331AECAF
MRATDTRGSSAASVSLPGAAPLEEWRMVTRGMTHVRSLRLAGLSREETMQMVAAAGAGTLGRRAVARLRDHTAGHPLYLQSLLNEADPQALADLARPLPVPSTLKALVHRTQDRLPADARNLIEALAILDTPTSLATTAQLTGLPDAAAPLEAALASGLIQWQPDQPTTPLRIHHQLQRDAIYHTISPVRRRALHTTAAALVGGDRAWDHRVAAADAYDPDLAGQLADEASRQVAQGRYHRAATLEVWAADLAPTRDAREHHLINAAAQLLAVQAVGRAQTLREGLERCNSSPARDAVLGYLAGQGGDLVTAEILLAPAAAVADTTTRLTAATWLGATHILQTDGPKAAAALRPVVDRMPPGPAARYACGLLAIAAGYAEGPPAGLAVLAEAGLPEHADQVVLADSRLLAYRGTLRVWAGHLGPGCKDLVTFTARQRTDGNLIVAPLEHYMLGFSRYFTGHWADAAISADQAVLVADTQERPYGLTPGHVVAVMAQAQQGLQEEAESHLADCHRAARSFPELNCLFPILGDAVVAQARADWPAMRQALRRLDDADAVTPGMRALLQVPWVPLYAEAFTATDEGTCPAILRRVENALRTFDRLAAHAPALAATSHWLHGRLAATRGDSATALHHYRAGLGAPVRYGDDIPLHRAFLNRDIAHHLLQTGRLDDRAEATQHLQKAHHTYTDLGAIPHAQRAAHDLALLRSSAPVAAAGGKHDPAVTLTAREHAVAHLAAKGLTNNEVARELFVSPKTVEYHLGHVYTKLRLTSRRQLHNALQRSADTPARMQGG